MDGRRIEKLTVNRVSNRWVERKKTNGVGEGNELSGWRHNRTGEENSPDENG